MTDSSTNSSAWNSPPADYLEPPAFGPNVTLCSIYIKTRDGTKLAADVYLPADLPKGDRLPTIVSFTPYYRRMRVREVSGVDGIGPSIAYAKAAFVAYGYALVIVDVRGTGASFGSRKGFRSPKERGDYSDVADWIVKQDWCNGRLGSTGISYGGAAADFLASTGHAAVKAIIPSFSVWDTYKDMFYPGGLLCTTVQSAYGAITTALDRSDRTIIAGHPYFDNPAYDGPAPVDQDDGGGMLRQALREHAANFDMISFMQALNCRDSSPLGDPDLTSRQISPSTYADGFSKDVAVYSVSGWRDGFGYADAAVRRHLLLKSKNKHLILGPWDHGAATNVSPRRTEVLPQFELINEYRRFFDHYLKGRQTGLGQEKPVHYFTMIEEKWKSSDAWPPENGRSTTFHLAPNGAATATPAAKNLAPSTYEVDFDVPSGNDTRYERIGLKAVDRYYDGWAATAGRRLSFTTEPFADGLEITGHPLVKLFMSSTSRDGAIFVYLEDVAADGHASYITEGVLRLIHRKAAGTNGNAAIGPDRDYLKGDIALMTPGEVVDVSVPLIPVSWLVQKGHRVRLSIAGADAAHFARVPVGETPVLNIFHDSERPSEFMLPVVSRK